MADHSSKKTLLTAVILSILLIMIVLLADSPDRRSADYLHSTLNAKPAGVKALYLLLKESGFRVERRQKGIETLSKTNPVSIIYISISPDEPYRRSEIDSLERLTRNGATVIFFMNHVIDSVIEKFGIKSSLTLRDSFYYRQQLLYSNLFFDSLFSGTDSAQGGIPLIPVFYSDSAMIQPLYGSDKNSSVMSVPYGKGELLLFNSPDYVTNKNIDRYQNINIFMNILCWSADGQPRNDRTVIFDEYHQGYKEFESLVSILDELPVRIALTLALIGLVMAVYSKSKRITRPVPIRKLTNRNSQAYIDSVTQAYQRSGAHRLVVQIWYQWVRRYLSSRYKTSLEIKWSKLLSEQFKFNENDLNKMFSQLNDLQLKKNNKIKESDTIRKRNSILTDQELVYYFKLLNKIYATRHYKRLSAIRTDETE